MPLEFALRPRLSLDRPTSRPRLQRPFPRLALAVVGYWLAVAFGTRALLESLTQGTAESRAEAAPTQDTSSVAEAPLSATLPLVPGASDVPDAPEVSNDPLPEPAVEPSPAPAAAAEPEPALERSIEPNTHVDPPPRAAPAPAQEPARLPSDAQTPPSEPPPRPRDVQAPAREPAPHLSDIRTAPVHSDATNPARTGSLPSCESAAAAANEIVDLGAARGAPDLTRNAFASVLENGAYLGSCNVPARTALDICAAVQDGKVIGVSVVAEPSSAALSACVRRAVAALHFPQSARLDVTRTRFEPAR